MLVGEYVFLRFLDSKSKYLDPKTTVRTSIFMGHDPINKTEGTTVLVPIKTEVRVPARVQVHPPVDP